MKKQKLKTVAIALMISMVGLLPTGCQKSTDTPTPESAQIESSVTEVTNPFESESDTLKSNSEIKPSESERCQSLPPPSRKLQTPFQKIANLRRKRQRLSPLKPKLQTPFQKIMSLRRKRQRLHPHSLNLQRKYLLSLQNQSPLRSRAKLQLKIHPPQPFLQS